jgi:hypothetical protein
MTITKVPKLFSATILVLLTFATTKTTTISALPSINLLDVTSKGNLQLQSIPSSLSTSKGIVTIISSPATPTSLLPDIDDFDKDEDRILTLLSSSSSSDDQDNETIRLVCRGSTLQGTTDIERSSLAFCSLLSDSIIVTGIVSGDLEGPFAFRHSRHSRTLTALFRAKLITNNIPSDSSDKLRQVFLLLVVDEDNNTINDLEETLKKEVVSLYQAVAAEKKTAPEFDSIYDLQILKDSSKVRNA